MRLNPIARNLLRLSLSVFALLIFYSYLLAAKTQKKSDTIPDSAIKLFWFDSAEKPRGRSYWFRDGEEIGDLYLKGADGLVDRYVFVGKTNNDDVGSGSIYILPKSKRQIFVPFKNTATLLISTREVASGQWKPWIEVSQLLPRENLIDGITRPMFTVSKNLLQSTDHTTPPSELEYWYKRQPGLWQMFERPADGNVVFNNFDVISANVESEVVQKQGGTETRTIWLYDGKISFPPFFPIPLPISKSIRRVDGVSTVQVDLKGNFTDFAKVVMKAFPDSVNEHGHPLEEKLRWDFRLISKDSVIDKGRIYFRATYRGDIETKGFLGPLGCHLEWVYPIIGISFRPSVGLSSDGKWYYKPEDLKIETAFRTDSNFTCSIFDKDVKHLVIGFFNPERIKYLVKVDLDKLTYPAPVSQIWNQMGGPFSKDGVCLYPRPQGFEFGDVTGTFESVRVPIIVKVGVTAIIAQPCPQPKPTAPRYSIQDMEPLGPVTLAIRLPYKALLDQIKPTGSGDDSDFDIGEVDIEGEVSSLSLSMIVNKPKGIGSAEFRVFPLVDPSLKALTFIFIPTSKTLQNSDPGRTMFINKIATILSSIVSLDLSGDIAKVKEKLNGVHTIKELRLKVSTDEFRPFFTASNRDSLDIFLATRSSITGSF